MQMLLKARGLTPVNGKKQLQEQLLGARDLPLMDEGEESDDDGADVDNDANFWLCPGCTTGLRSFSDLWGHGVQRPPPSDGVRPLGESIDIGTPEGPTPYQQSVANDLERQALFVDADRRYSRIGGSKAVEVAAELLVTFRTLRLSEKDQDVILRSLNRLHERHLVELTPVGASFNTSIVPKDQRTLVSRGEHMLPRKLDVVHREHIIDTSSLLQLQQTVVVSVTDIPMVIQAMLLDPRIPSNAWYFGHGVEYKMQDGSSAVGTEFWQASRWRELAKTVPLASTMLAITLWTDKADSASGSLHPLVMSLGNISRSVGLNDGCMVTAGMLPRIEIRRPQGTKKAEGLKPEQKRAKAQIMADAIGLLLAEFEVLGASGTTYRFGDEKMMAHCRLLAYVCDKEEEGDVACIRKSHCPRCLGYGAAKRAEAQEGRTHSEARPHYRTDSACHCDTAARRTAAGMLDEQAKLCQLVDHKMKVTGDVEARSAESGVCFGVKPHLDALTSFIPPECGGIYQAIATDYLHVFLTGVVPKVVRMIDAYMCDRFQRSAGFKRYEDVRNLMEERLQLVPTMLDGDHRLITFKMGWYVLCHPVHMNTIKSSSLPPTPSTLPPSPFHSPASTLPPPSTLHPSPSTIHPPPSTLH